MLPLVKNDPWLEPVVKQVDKRHETNAVTAGGTANGLPPRIISR